MIQRIAMVLLVGVFSAAAATPAGAFGMGAGTAEDVRNERDIRALYDEFEAAWNRHDAKAMAVMWAVDGDHVEPDGQIVKGQPEVAGLLERQHTGVFGSTQLDLHIDTVWFISGSVALVDGTYRVTGIRTPDGKELEPRNGRLTSVLLKEKEQWLIEASRLMIPTALPYKP